MRIQKWSVEDIAALGTGLRDRVGDWVEAGLLCWSPEKIRAAAEEFLGGRRKIDAKQALDLLQFNIPDDALHYLICHMLPAELASQWAGVPVERGMALWSWILDRPDAPPLEVEFERLAQILDQVQS